MAPPPPSARGAFTRRLTSSGATLEARAVPMYPSMPYSMTASSPALASRTTHERSSASKSKEGAFSDVVESDGASLTSPVSRSARRTVLCVRATT